MIRLSMPNLGDEEINAAAKIFRSGFLVHGEECERFENEIAHYLDVKYVVVVSSGTAALHLSLIALGIGKGDAVLVPDFTFPATVNAVELVGAVPVFVDVDPATYNITSANILKAVNTWEGKERISAIIPVHEFGCPADMTGIMAIAAEYDLKVIEDAACALGARHCQKSVGTFGDTGCFSFHPRKSITTGEGGAICTNKKNVAEKLRMLKNHGMSKKQGTTNFVLPGYNYRMTNVQGAIGRIQLRKLPDWIEKRRKLKKTYDLLLNDLDGVTIPKDVEGHTWQTYMIMISEVFDRNHVISVLRERGIESNIGAQSILSQEFYKKYDSLFPGILYSKRLFNQGIALPFCQTYDKKTLTVVGTELIKILRRCH